MIELHQAHRLQKYRLDTYKLTYHVHKLLPSNGLKNEEGEPERKKIKKEISKKVKQKYTSQNLII